MMLEEQESNIDHSGRTWAADVSWLTDDVALGGCFPSEKAGVLAREHGIGAVVDLRQEDRDDDEALRDAGIAFLHLPTPDLEPVTPQMLDQGVAFTRRNTDAGTKVLIHCQHGIGRSALLALCVLVDRGWDPLEALKHAKDRRWQVSPSRSQYDGWSRWLEAHAKRAPDYHTFGCVAYRHLAGN